MGVNVANKDDLDFLIDDILAFSEEYDIFFECERPDVKLRQLLLKVLRNADLLSIEDIVRIPSG